MKIINKNVSLRPKTSIVQAIIKGVSNLTREKNPPISKLTHAQFLDWLRSTKGVVIIGMETLTDANALKRNNPIGKILKRSRFTAVIGAFYEDAVNRELQKNNLGEKFVAGPRSFGVWDTYGKILKHNDEFYINTQSTPKQREFSSGKVLDYRDAAGRIISKDQINNLFDKGILKRPSVSAKQAACGLQDDVRVRTLKLSSIKKIRVYGKSYELVPS